MRFLILLSLIIAVSLTACKKSCYRCLNNTACAVCIKGGDSIHVCYPIGGISDSLKKYTGKGYQCTIYSGLQYELDVCENDSLRVELERESYTCDHN